jgi:hypothetical protein
LKQSTGSKPDPDDAYRSLRTKAFQAVTDTSMLPQLEVS